jgi:carbamate kinase
MTSRDRAGLGGRMRVLVAVGGNAIVGPDGSTEAAGQQDAVERGMTQVAALVAQGVDVVLTHGNGPQVGNLLAQSQLGIPAAPALPLDLCVASTQGSIGVLMLNALERQLRAAGVGRQVAALVSRVLVAADDPGFAAPTKPVGRYVEEAEARTHMELGEVWRRQGDRGWRRVVASPEPLRILDGSAVRALVDAGFLVVAEGGGGVPVIDLDGGDSFGGVAAVVDKDLTASLLARTVDADVLCIVTDVPHVMVGYGTPEARPVTRVTASELRALAGEGHFAAGSMGPKVEAALRFVEGGGSRAVIGSLDHIRAAVCDGEGTVVVSDEA